MYWHTVAEEIGAPQWCGYAKRIFGLVHVANASWSQAERQFESASDILEHCGALAELAHVYVDWGRLLQDELGMPEQAMEKIDRARTIWAEFKNDFQLASVDAQRKRP